MGIRKFFLMVLFFLVRIENGQACAENFIFELLPSRSTEMGFLPESTFDNEVARFTPSPKQFKVVDSKGDYDEFREKIERSEFGEQDFARLTKARSQKTAEAAYRLSEGLPEDVRLYTAGAVAWRNSFLRLPVYPQGEILPEDFEDVRHFVAARENEWKMVKHYFQAVLDLPVDQRKYRAVWAAYMLASIDATSTVSRKLMSAPRFERVREEAQLGASDPLGLAVDSYDVEAKYYQTEKNIPKTIEAYAHLAAYRQQDGRFALLLTARRLMRDTENLPERIKNPFVQKLLVAYLLTRSHELSRLSDSLSSRIEQLIAVVEKSGEERMAYSGRLAALAYRSGRFDLAEKLVAYDDSALSWWIKAKLLLRKGKMEDAAKAYAEAAKSFPKNEFWGQYPHDLESYNLWEVVYPTCRISVEQSVLALARNDYLTAFDYLYQSSFLYWADTAYLAEQVLTADELKQYVDAHVPPEHHEKNDPFETSNYLYRYNDQPIPEEILNKRPRAGLLRWLLARRLMREEREQEAISYFDVPELREQATKHAEQRKKSLRGGRIHRAQALFEAAKLMRKYGLELFGYEGQPDYRIYDGNFDLSPVALEEENSETQQNLISTKNSPVVLPLWSEREKNLSSDAPQETRRFHYRWKAAKLAEKAADLLPARSQAFGTVLCRAHTWIKDRDDEGAKRLYRRYVREGALGAWTCTEPDWKSAQRRLTTERWDAIKRHAKQNWGMMASFSLGITAWGIWRLLRRKKQFRN